MIHMKVYFLKKLQVSQSTLLPTCSFVCQANDISFCVCKKAIKRLQRSRLDSWKRWVNQNLPFEINDLYEFGVETPWKLYNYTDRSTKNKRHPLRSLLEWRKGVSSFTCTWSKLQDQLSCNYPITCFIIITWIAKSIIEGYLFMLVLCMNRTDGTIILIFGIKKTLENKKIRKTSCVTVKLVPTKHIIWKARAVFKRFWKAARELFLRSNPEPWVISSFSKHEGFHGIKSLRSFTNFPTMDPEIEK